MRSQDFNTLKRKVYLAYHQDGVLDLAAGSVVFCFGMDMLTDNIVFTISGGMMILFYFLLKQLVTIPRFGYVRFDSQKKTVAWGFVGVAVGVAVILLIVVFNFLVFRQPASPEMAAMIQRYHMVPLSGLIFGLPALGAAVFLGLRRYSLYALLSVALPALGAWLNAETYTPIIVFGLTMLVFGAVLLVTFLKAYPRKDEANDHVD